MSLFSIERRHTPSLYRRESVSLSSICRGDRLLLCTEERVSLFSIERRQTPSLYRRESVALLYVEEADSSLFSIESISLLYVEEADCFSVQRRECLSSP